MINKFANILIPSEGTITKAFSLDARPSKIKTYNLVFNIGIYAIQPNVKLSLSSTDGVHSDVQLAQFSITNADDVVNFYFGLSGDYGSALGCGGYGLTNKQFILDVVRVSDSNTSSRVRYYSSFIPNNADLLFFIDADIAPASRIINVHAGETALEALEILEARVHEQLTAEFISRMNQCIDGIREDFESPMLTAAAKLHIKAAGLSI
jgi:hypothetical protein